MADSFITVLERGFRKINTTLSNLALQISQKVGRDELRKAHPVQTNWVADGISASYSLPADLLDINSVLVTIDGLIQFPGTDYTFTEDVMTFDEIPLAGSIVTAGVFGTFIYDQEPVPVTRQVITDLLGYDPAPKTDASFSGTTSFASRPTFGANTPWDSGNLTPTLYLLKTDDVPAANITGVLDISQIPVLPTQRPIMSSGGLADLTTEQQTDINEGTLVGTTDGKRWVYSGTGSKTVEASYVVLADITPEWNTIENRPSTFPAAPHEHPMGDVTGLNDALGLKANSADAVFTGSIPVRVQQSASTGAGFVDLAGVSANSSGSVVFRDNAGARLGYLGNANATTLNIAADVANIALNRRPTFAGNLAWDAGNFNPTNYAGLTSNPTFNTDIGVNAAAGANTGVYFRADDVVQWRLVRTTNNDLALVRYVGGVNAGSTFTFNNAINSGTIAADMDMLGNVSVTKGAGTAAGVGGTLYAAIDGLHIGLAGGRDVVFRSDNGNMGISGNFYANGGTNPVWHSGNFDPGPYMSFKGLIPASQNLDTYTTPGVYHQNSNSNATGGTNYPAGVAGLLEVMTNGAAEASALVYQRYTTYAGSAGSTNTNDARTFVRSRYAGNWAPWRQLWDSTLFNPADFPVKSVVNRFTIRQEIFAGGNSIPLYLSGSQVAGTGIRFENTNGATIQRHLGVTPAGELRYGNSDIHTANDVVYTSSNIPAASTIIPGIMQASTSGVYRIGAVDNYAVTPAAAWGAVAPVALSSVATVTPNLNSGINFTLTMTRSSVLGNPTNALPGTSGMIKITQGSTGNWAISSWGTAWKFAGGTKPTLSTAVGAIDYLFYTVLSTTEVVASLVKDVK